MATQVGEFTAVAAGKHVTIVVRRRKAGVRMDLVPVGLDEWRLNDAAYETINLTEEEVEALIAALRRGRS